MNGMRAFCKKELLESIRTYRLLILMAVLLVFAMLSPLTAKLIPELIPSLMPEGMGITLPPPTALDSWEQFFKNVSQMGLLVTVILFAGALTGEAGRGTLIPLLTKGLPRRAAVLSKFAVQVVLWTAGYALAFGVTLGYTVYLFPEGGGQNLLFSVVCLWLFGLFLLAALLLFGAFGRSMMSALLLTGALLAALMLVDIIPATHNYNPLTLAAASMALMRGTAQPCELWPAIAIACGGAAALLWGAVAVFNRRRL